MTVTKSRHLYVTFLLLASSGAFVACSQAQHRSEAPTEEFRRREPQWISGEIMGVDRVPIDQYNESTIHVIVNTEGEQNVDLELGPGWYMEETGLTFEPQQRIEFRGAHNPNGSYVAHSLRRGAQTIEIRNPDGSPRWPNKAAAPGSSAAPAPTTPSPSGAAPEKPAPLAPAAPSPAR